MQLASTAKNVNGAAFGSPLRFPQLSIVVSGKYIIAQLSGIGEHGIARDAGKHRQVFLHLAISINGIQGQKSKLDRKTRIGMRYERQVAVPGSSMTARSRAWAPEARASK
jgi:hypothetical protein